MNTKQTVKRGLSFLLVLCLVFSLMGVPLASAAGDETVLYLKPNANWQVDNARFAVYYWNNGGSNWADMTAVEGEEGLYEASIPAGYTNVIFCRMNPNNTANSWDTKWNQTADLTVPTDGTNCYTVKENTWDKGGGEWSSYTPALTLYLKPNANWQVDNARFAAYFFGNGDTWISMTDEDGDGYYEVTAPEGYPNVIFCRMNPNNTANSWDTKWNQTADLTVPTDDKVCYTVKENTWDKGGGEWSVYPPEDEGGEEPAPADTYYVAGASALCGSEWNPADENNKMTLNADSGLYEKMYTNVDAGSYEFKVVANGAWGNEWPASNYVLTLTEKSNVVITFNADTKTVSHMAAAVPTVDYYLFGYINGADYGCNDDWQTLGEYKFVNGKLTATFTANSYVALKTGDNANWYMAESYCTADTVVLKNTTTGTAEKMFVPGNVELEFTLTDNGDDTFTLSYTRKEEPKPEAVDYYLVGYINNTDYTGTDYKFVDGKLTATFTTDTYVYVMDSKGASYHTETYCTDTTATLKAGASEKMKVPSNTELTFTLAANDDGTLTLSYAAVVDVPEIPEGYNTVTIHYLKPSGWGSTVNAWVWDANGAIPGYELYQNAWPGSPIPANADKAGWYDLVIGTKEPQAFNFIFNNGSAQTKDLTTGTITGPTELWVVGENVYTTAPREWTHYTATLHFQKPGNWDAVYAYAWTEDGQLMGDWPGTVTSPSANEGWYNTTIYVEIGKTLNFIFNKGEGGNGNQTADLTAGKMTGNIELWVLSDGSMASNAPDNWVDETRTIHLPGTLPGLSWDAGSNQMTYDATLGFYVITFENVPAGTYEYKIAVNGGWDENYGAGGEVGGANMSVRVPVAQDVTFWYNDSTHRVVCSVTYDMDAEITLSGIGSTVYELSDFDLDGIFTVTVKLPAGTYNDLKISYDGKEVGMGSFELTGEKEVTFNYDPATGMAYHNGSDRKVETGRIYYNTKDLGYKVPFGAVATGEDVTFAIDTGLDATAVVLVVRGLPAVKMEKDGVSVNGVQRWTCTTSFDSIGEYEYYFAITNGSDMVFYCDDTYNNYYKTGDYGVGGIGNPEDIFAYDLVVYQAGYETPDWMKDAVIYQIFPDRFFDGLEYNNDDQTWARGEVNYEYVSDWYLLPENPEAAKTYPDAYPTYAFKGDGEWSNEIYGGDLKGITERIDYLKALGVNVIYLNPVFWSISNHRYDAVDYGQIDPILGTLGNFEELVAVAEANDMHIILDGVFNHVSDDSVYFDRYYKFLGTSEKIGAYPYWAYVYDLMNEEGKTQAEAEEAAVAYFTAEYGITDYSYTEWFAVNNVAGTAVDNIGLRAGKTVYTYEGWWGYDSMPVIYSTNGSEYQTGNWAEQIISGEDSINAYWISKGMDGWRLDVANEVSDETWQNFRDSVKALDSEAVIIGEIWADATRYLMGDMYDSVMNYVFRDAVAGFARGYLINRDNKAEKYDADYTAADAMTTLEILRERYPQEAFYAMMNLVASHDTSRILSYLDDVEDDRYQKDLASAFPMYETTSERAKQLQYVVSFLQFTYAGAPTIYYGDEIGMTGSDDPDDRRAFTWGKGNKDIVEWYATLAAIRAEYPALRTGAVTPVDTGNDDVMGFIRSDDANTLVVLANRAASKQTVACEGTWVDLLTGEKFTDSVTVPAYRGVILVAETEVKEYSVEYADLAPAYDPAYIVERGETPPANPQQPSWPSFPIVPPAPVAPGGSCTCGKFTDVNTALWYHEAICFVVSEGIMKGTGNGSTFSPYLNLSRAMLMTMLARLDGVNTDGGANWYEIGLKWAVEQGISDGTNPSADITREQMVVMLYRYAGSPVVVGANLNRFPDADKVSSWAKEAMDWAVSNGIIQGKGDGTLDPQGTATRAEIAQILYNYLSK